MLRIGFAKEYYTLWNVEVIENQLNDFSTEEVTEYNYIQNLSKTLDNAINSAKSFGCEDLVPDNNLHGKNQSWRNTKVKINRDSLDTFSDLKLYDIFLNNEEKEDVLNILLERGFLVDVGGILFLKEYETKALELYDEYLNPTIKKEFVLERNLSDGGEYKEYIFKDFKLAEYGGCYYGVPTINGKGKRCKGKTISIKEYERVENDSKFTDLISGTWKEEKTGRLLFTTKKFQPYLRYRTLFKILSFDII